jgi:phosphate transport system substrate-binding protein
MKNSFSKTAAAALFMGFFLTCASAQEIAIIANKSNPVDDLTAAQLKKILLGEQAQWSGGKQVMVLLRNPGSPERQIPLQAICGMTETDFNQYFAHASLKGGMVTAPKSLGSAAMLRQLVTSLPGAIGFVAVGDVTDAVKVIKLDGNAPGGADYKLKK